MSKSAKCCSLVPPAPFLTSLGTSNKRSFGVGTGRVGGDELDDGASATLVGDVVRVCCSCCESDGILEEEESWSVLVVSETDDGSRNILLRSKLMLSSPSMMN